MAAFIRGAGMEFFADREKMVDFAKFYIDRYFSALGVPESIFSNPKYVGMCLDMDIRSAMEKAYAAMERSGRFDDEGSSHPIERDVRFVIRTLEAMSRVVPQEFSAGMLLAHLEIVEGIAI